MDNVFLQQIPAYHFGTLADTKADQYGATITIAGATMEDYEAYTASIAGQFPQNVNSLDGPTPFVIKTNGTYTITVSFDGETILGGIGIVPGAMLGGLVIGLVESFSTSYISSSLSDTFVFLILIVVLIIKPAGILGKNVGEKV